MVKTVKRLTSLALFVVLGFGLTAPTLAHAGSNSQQKQQQKQYNDYLKHQNKMQKKQLKDQKKQLKQFNKQHGNTTTTVT
jgi:hypothetical protein